MARIDQFTSEAPWQGMGCTRSNQHEVLIERRMQVRRAPATRFMGADLAPAGSWGAVD